MLSQQEVRGYIARELTEASGLELGALRENRRKALDLFFGRPLGNEVEGRSTVVSRDLAETILWIMPSLLRVFAQKDVVQFDAVGPEDEVNARNESMLVNHVFMKQNNGFMVIHDWFFDALLQRVGYVKVYHEDKKITSVEDYTGLTDGQMAALIKAGGTKVKVLAYEERPEEILNPETGATEVQVFHDLRIRRTETRRQARVVGVPPEELVVCPSTRGSIQNAPAVFQLVRTTRSALIQEGYPKALVKRLSSYELSDELTDEMNRNTDENYTSDEEDDDELRLVEAYIRIDEDEDGIAELRRILIAGNEILEDDEIDGLPFASLSPIPLPHRHLGMSYFDLLEDLVMIKTALTRQLLDNAYLSNNNRWAADQNNVNLRDLMTSRPGGIIRTNGNPAGVLQVIQPIPIINRLAPVIDYIDGVKENRAGVGRITAGLDSNVLQNSTKGAFDVATNKAAERIEAIARIFAETGVKDLFLLLHQCLRKNQNWPLKIKLGGQWVEENPYNWEDRTDLTISAGIGNNTREEIRTNLGLIAQMQEKIAQAGIGVVTPINVFQLATRMQKELGFESAQFFTDPSQAEPPQPEKNPLIQVAEIETQAALQKEQVRAQADLQKQQMKAADNAARLEQERALAITRMEIDKNVDLAEAGIGAELQLARIAAAARAGRGPAQPPVNGQQGVSGSGEPAGSGNPVGDASGFPVG